MSLPKMPCPQCRGRGWTNKHFVVPEGEEQLPPKSVTCQGCAGDDDKSSGFFLPESLAERIIAYLEICADPMKIPLPISYPMTEARSILKEMTKEGK